MEEKYYLQLENLRKSYDEDAYAVRGISLNIRKGEFISFLGPSGSGKTTTLMMIAGFETPDSGNLFLDGRSLTNIKPYRRNVGMVFQNYALFPHLTVEANVGYPLRMRGVRHDEIRSRVQESLRLVELGDFSARRPAELSGGQQQRVALARALIFEPDVLLLDEPLGALDKQLREQMQIEIKRIHRKIGVTTIYVTHDQSEAMTLSDRVAVFNKGLIEQVDAPTEIYLRPNTHFVASFIGDSNFFDAVVKTPEKGELHADGLGTLAGNRAVELSPGQHVHVLVRPESIRPLVGGQQLPNTFDMKVGSVINYGDSVLLVGDINDRPVRVRSPGTRWSGVQPSQILRVGWDNTASHLIPQNRPTHQ